MPKEGKWIPHDLSEAKSFNGLQFFADKVRKI